MARSLFALMLLLTGCATSLQTAGANNDHLFVWAGAGAKQESDFLAVIDVDPKSANYAEIVASTVAPGPRGGAHHTDHEMPPGGVLLANAFGSGRTVMFDVSHPTQPKLIGSFAGAGEYNHAHSFVRLPDGNVLATFQERGHGNEHAGALVKLSPTGEVLKTSDAADPGIEPFVRPYSLAVVPALDRIVTTSADMHAKAVSRAVQVWRLSDMSLIKTVMLPAPPSGKHNEDPAEPRLLSDEKTVVVSTFTCGLFLIKGLEGQNPSAEFIHKFSDSDTCAVPVVAGRFWVQTDASIPGLISLDMTNPSRPKEVDRLVLAPDELPHWIALAPDGKRIVISGGEKALRSRVLLAQIAPGSGKLSLDPSFRSKGAARPGVSFERAQWPHGPAGPAAPHGAVFSRGRAGE